jgi:hypothetical protein
MMGRNIIARMSITPIIEQVLRDNNGTNLDN